MITPLFLFSLPRSGSTLAQRMLAAHPAVATVTEPWILLPFLYARKEEGVYAEYRHDHLRPILLETVLAEPAWQKSLGSPQKAVLTNNY